MSTEFESILSQAQHLSQDERVMLANALYESVESFQEHLAISGKEAARRAALVDSGEMETFDIEDVMARVRKLIGK